MTIIYTSQYRKWILTLGHVMSEWFLFGTLAMLNLFLLLSCTKHRFTFLLLMSCTRVLKPPNPLNLVRMSSINMRDNTPDLWPSNPPGFLLADSWCFSLWLLLHDLYDFWGWRLKVELSREMQCRFELIVHFMCLSHAHEAGSLTGHFYLPPLIVTYRCTVTPCAGRNALNCFTCTIFPGACLCLNIFSMFCGLISTQPTRTAHCGCALCSVSNFLESHSSFLHF